MNYPIILEKADKHLMGLDLTSKLLQDRIIMLDEPISSEFASNVILQLLYLKNKSKEPVTIFVNGPGGGVYAGLGIYDMIENLKSSGIIVKTRGIGIAASMQSLLLSSGSPNERKVYFNTTIMIHQPSGGAEGQVTDLGINYKESQRLKEKLTNIYIKHGASEKIKDLMERDCWLTAEQAIELGLIDGII